VEAADVEEYGHVVEPSPKAISSQLATFNRKTLLDLRDSLRSLLTVLESQ
jgi:hypothetical protein